MGRTKIEWATDSWNPIRARNRATGNVGWHCEHATTGCENCYAEQMNKRLGTGLPFKPGHRKDIELFLDEKMLLAPLRWRKPRMIFVCSMTDLFASFMSDEWIDRVFAVMALCPHHTFQVLTKRAARMRDYVAARAAPVRRLPIAGAMNMMGAGAAQPIGHRMWPLPNVWLGVSAERQQEADERIPHLLNTPAAVRFVSCEPLLGPINLSLGEWVGWALGRFDDPPTPRVDWVIVGGESGPGARPMHPSWARSLRDQCSGAGVAFFFKQHGEFAEALDHRPIPQERMSWVADDGRHIDVSRWRDVERDDQRDVGNWKLMARVGKKRAGRLLDGREHNDMPEIGARR